MQLTGLIKMLISPEPIVANVTTNDVANADGSTTTTVVSLCSGVCVCVCAAYVVCACVCACERVPNVSYLTDHHNNRHGEALLPPVLLQTLHAQVDSSTNGPDHR